MTQVFPAVPFRPFLSGEVPLHKHEGVCFLFFLFWVRFLCTSTTSESTRGLGSFARAPVRRCPQEPHRQSTEEFLAMRSVRDSRLYRTLETQPTWGGVSEVLLKQPLVHFHCWRQGGHVGPRTVELPVRVPLWKAFCAQGCCSPCWFSMRECPF